MNTKVLLQVLDGIPSAQKPRVYKQLLTRHLMVHGYTNYSGSCGCPLVVAATAVANESVNALTDKRDRDPVIAERLRISEGEVRHFITAWDHSGFLDRMKFRFAILTELVRLEVAELRAAYTPHVQVPLRLTFTRRRHA